MTELEDIAFLQNEGAKVVNDTTEIFICDIAPTGPEPDDGRYIDLLVKPKQCQALQRIGTIVGVKVDLKPAPSIRITVDKTRTRIFDFD
ncbi:MAG: hypothetical protein ACRD8W_32280 [Nitrososphaeraceae archaeon]